MLHVNVDLYHTTNRTATTNGPISLAGAASPGKYGYGNGIAVTERISGTVLWGLELEWLKKLSMQLKPKKNFLKYFEYFNTMLKIRKGVGLTKKI